MSIALSRGGSISLSKEAGGAGLSTITVGLGWDARAPEGTVTTDAPEGFWRRLLRLIGASESPAPACDLDVTVYLLAASGKVRSDADFIFYNQLKSSCGAVEHLGDTWIGSGDGDDEQVKINVVGLPADVQKVAFAVTIHEASRRTQNFGMVTNAFIRVVNDADGKEMVRFDLGADVRTETAVVFGEVCHNGAEWDFKAIGEGYAGGLAPLARNFGVDV